MASRCPDRHIPRRQQTRDARRRPDEPRHPYIVTHVKRKTVRFPEGAATRRRFFSNRWASHTHAHICLSNFAETVLPLFVFGLDRWEDCYDWFFFFLFEDLCYSFVITQFGERMIGCEIGGRVRFLMIVWWRLVWR